MLNTEDTNQSATDYWMWLMNWQWNRPPFPYPNLELCLHLKYLDTDLAILEIVAHQVALISSNDCLAYRRF